MPSAKFHPVFTLRRTPLPFPGRRAGNDGLRMNGNDSLPPPFPAAVVCSGHQADDEEGLELTRVNDLIDVIKTPELIKRGQPAPDMYLLAAERPGLTPSRRLVFDDGEPGIEAARAAGMDAVVVNTTWTPPS